MFDLFGLEKPHKITDGDEVELLTTVHDEAILSIVRSMLDEENIPYLVRERNGSAMTMIVGFALCGADVFVPAAALEKAKELIAGVEGETVVFVDDDGNEISVDEAAEQAAEDD